MERTTPMQSTTQKTSPPTKGSLPGSLPRIRKPLETWLGRIRRGNRVAHQAHERPASRRPRAI